MKNTNIKDAVKNAIIAFSRKFTTGNINYYIAMFLRVALTILLLAVSFLIFTRTLDFFNVTPFTATPKKAYFGEIRKDHKEPSNSDIDNYFVQPSFNNIPDDNTLEILSLLTIFGGVLAYIFKIVVQRNLEDENRHYTEAQMLKVGGSSAYHRFLIYRDACPLKKTPQKTLAIVDKALEDTEKGLKLAASLDGSTSRNELLVCLLKNNVAWLYKEKLEYIKNNFSGVELDILKKECEKKRNYVFCTMRYVLSRADNHPEHDYNWRDTDEEVRRVFG